ncbi:MAG: DNRLRE domain-containing protein [archaeon]|nr:MAG: DNRLRE domain-containing protein [archaeon]
MIALKIKNGLKKGSVFARNPYNTAFVMVLAFVLFPVISSLTQSSEVFFVDAEIYQESISFDISGPSNTPFSLTVLDSSQNEIFERTTSTDSSGSYKLFLPKFENGFYTVILRSGKECVTKEFEIGDMQKTVSSVSTTTSWIEPTVTVKSKTETGFSKTTYGSTWTENCNGDGCTRSLYSGKMNMEDSEGIYRPFNELVGFAYNASSQNLELEWNGKTANLEPYVVMGGFEQGIPSSMNFKTEIKEGSGYYKWSHLFTNVQGLEYVGLTISSGSGITVLDNDTLLIGELEIDFSDLYNLTCDEEDHCTTSGILVETKQIDENTADIRISNFTGSDIVLDPTVQLQAPDSENLDDTHVRSNSATTNYGDDSNVRIRDRTDRAYRTYIKFNISSIPNKVGISESLLCLYLYQNGATAQASAHHVYNHTWTEGGIIWNDQPCDPGFDNSAECNLTSEDTQATTAVGWVCWNVTNTVRSEYENGDNNVSIVIRTPETASSAEDRLYSKEYGVDTSLRPYMNVTYDNPPVITIESPLNQVYQQNWVWSNVTLDETGDWCGVSLNDGANQTMSNDSTMHFYLNLSGISDGSNYVVFYCNDTKGNMNNSDTRYFSVDTTPPNYSDVQQNPAGNPVYGNDVQCNSTWNDAVGLGTVIFRSNYTGTWTNYTTTDPICDNQSNIYYCSIPSSELPGGKTVGWNYWANDTLDDWNDTMAIQSFTVQKAPTEINLLLNGTDGDVVYEVGQIANITAALNISGVDVEIWTNFTGITENVSNSPGFTPLTNFTNTSSFSPDDMFNVTGYFAGNQNYTNSSESHLMIMSADATKPVIADVDASPETSGLGRIVTISANVTDNSNVDRVFVNITLPDDTLEWREMTNYTQDIYEYNYTPWQTGSYYYSIWANDTYGNIQEYDPYFYVNGSALITVFAIEDSYGLNQYVNLTLGKDLTSDDRESGEIQKKAQTPGTFPAEFFDGFESGGITGNWTVIGNPGTYNSTDVQLSACTSPNSGLYYLWMDVTSSNQYETNVIKTTYDFSGASNIILSFYHIETGEESHQLGDHYGDYQSGCSGNSACGDGVFFTCNGSYWYRLEALTTDEGSWGYHEHNISADPDFCSEVNGSFAVKFMQHDNFPCTNDGRGFDDINISYSALEDVDREANTSYTTYNDVLSGNMEDLTKLTVTVNVSFYNNSGSSNNGNGNPDLQLEMATTDGGGWIEIGNFSVNSTGNFSLSTTNSSVLSAWETAGNRDLRIRGVNFDYNDSSNIDEINWTDIWVTAYNGSSLFNNGPTDISGYLLMEIQTNNSGSWNVVEIIIDDTNTSTLRNISAGEYLDVGSIWNAEPWSTYGQETGWYRVYAALTDDEGNVLQNDDSSYIENVDYFELTLFVFSDITDTPDPVGYGYNVTISGDITGGDVDTALVEITYPDSASYNFTMVNISADTWQYNFSDTWQWSGYSYRIWANDSSGAGYFSDVNTFNVTVNATIDVSTENDSYGPNEYVNITVYYKSDEWWNSSWESRKQVNVTEPGVGDRTFWPIDTYVTFAQGKVVNCTKEIRVTSGKIDEISSQVYDEKYSSGYCVGANVVFLSNVSEGSTSTYYIYYNNSQASKPSYTGLNDPSVVDRGTGFSIGTSYGTGDTIQINGTYSGSNQPLVYFDLYSAQSIIAYDDWDLSPGMFHFWSNAGDVFGGCTFSGEADCGFITQHSDATNYSDAGNASSVVFDVVGPLMHKITMKAPGVANPAYPGVISGSEYTYVWRIYYTPDYEISRIEANYTSNFSTSFTETSWPDWPHERMPSWDINPVQDNFSYITPSGAVTEPLLGTELAQQHTDWNETWGVMHLDGSYGQTFGYFLLNSSYTPNNTNWAITNLGGTGGLWGMAWVPFNMQDSTISGIYTYEAYYVTLNGSNYVPVRNEWKKVENPVSVTLGSNESYDRISKVVNTGSVDMKYYIIMRVQHWTGSGWENTGFPVMDQSDGIQSTDAGQKKYLDTLWEAGGGWNTTLEPAGTYRIYAALVDLNGNALKDYSGSDLVATYNFTIISAYMELTNLTHENEYNFDVEEYETGDNIAWINVTVTNRNTTSVNASITLNVLDHLSSMVDWGPDETQYCGNLDADEACEKKFDNQTYGYPIPLDATSGNYNFFWNVTMGSDSGNTTQNSSINFTIHHVPDGFSSNMTPEKIYQNKSSLYNFTVANPWSKNLTSVNVTVNCPQGLGFTCNCTLAGQTNQNYCNLGTITGGGWKNATFNISTNSTPAGDYHINATINYTNPGGEYHSWGEQEDKILMLRIPGLSTEISEYPTIVTRGGSGDLRGYVNNTIVITVNDLWLNWTLPSGWTNSSGNLNENNETLAPGNIFWNNITAGLVISSQLGPQEVRLDTSCQEGYTDWDIVTITVYANTTINPSVNNSDPVGGETVRVSAYLKYDNGTEIPNQNITFNDTTTGYFIGWDLTDSGGLATVDYQLSSSETLGNHQINVSYDGKSSIYTNPSWNTTNITVHDKPFIKDVVNSPDSQGYGQNVTISANVTDWDGVNIVRVYVKPPEESYTAYDMTNYTQDVYEYNFSGTWKNGQYSYYVWAQDTAGKTNQSSVYYFNISSNATLNVKTIDDSYGPLEYVNLTSYIDQETTKNASYDVVAMFNGTRIDDPGTAGIGYKNDTSLDLADDDQITGIYDASGGDYTDTQSDDGSYWWYGSQGGSPNAYGELTFNITSLGIDENHITRLNFELVYCHDGSNGGGPSCDGDSPEGVPVGFQDVEVYNYSSGSWVDIGDLSTSDWGYEVNGSWDAYGKMSDFVNDSSNEIKARYEITYLGDDSLLAIDYAALNITYTTVKQRYYLKFNLSEIPDGAKILSANLTVSVTASASATGLVYHTNGTYNSSTPVNTIYDDGQPSECSESNPIGNFSASTAGNKTIDVLVSVNESYMADKDLVAYLINESGENAYFEIDGSQGTNQPELKIAYIRSAIKNTGNKDIKGYLTMKVQRYVGGGWQDVSGGIVLNNESHNISAGASLALDTLWNPSAWNTDLEPAGTYRVLGYLADPSGNILKNDDDSDILGYYQFSITEPLSLVQIQEIRIFDVTDASDKHTNTSDPVGSGLNTTFDLYTGNVYRAEIVAWVNDTSESNWTITSSDVIFHENLDSSWNINHTHDIWYENSTLNYTGGNWSPGKIEWNTSQGNMLVQVNNNVTFYYIFNITTGSGKKLVHFLINDTFWTEEDYSTYNLIPTEGLPPKLYNEIYGLTDYIVNRGDSLAAYARWNEEINDSKTEYNDTAFSLFNHTISPPYTGNWTNRTLYTNVSWLLGVHSLKIYSSDLNGNWNNTLYHLNFEVWGWSSIPSSYLDPSTVVQGNPLTVYCRVVSDNTSGVGGYNVVFYNSTNQLGTNNTNQTGWARFTFVDNSLGYENITCNITENSTLYYNVTSDYYEIKTLRTIETEPPKYSQVSQNVSVVHKGDAILYKSYWDDNEALDYAWLSTNETGTWQNSSLADAIVIENWAEFELTIPMSMTPGILGWRIYANDSSSNENMTQINTTEVWGWSEVSDSDLNPNIIYEGSSTLFSCRVTDLNGSAISGYNISFYNSTNILGANQTNSSGWAVWKYIDYSNGTDTLVCNITDYAAIMYNASSNNNKTETLTTKEPGEDITPPFAITYGINDTVVWKGDALLIYAQWNESIGNSYTMFNDTSSQIVGYATETIGGDNWTNHTINTNSSWIVGVHVTKINASDQVVPPNWNDSLGYKTFDVWGRSKVEWTGPSGSTYRGTVPLTCRVIDKDGLYGIENYQVDFYDDDWDYINSDNTNSTGYATVNWDAQTETVGPKTLRCLINNKPSAYYNTTAADDDASGSVTLIGILNISMGYPANESIYQVESLTWLNSTTKDENDIAVTPDQANWTNTTDYIASGENTTWIVPSGHSVGPELVTISVTKQYYDSGEDSITIFVRGWSKVDWISPDSGDNYTQGEIVPLTCLVENSNTSVGIQDYLVNFYVENSTHSVSLGSNFTNSTGHAIGSWDTTWYEDGVYYPKCNITDNSTLYYNASESYEDNTTVNITLPEGKLIVFLNEPPDNTITPRYKNFTVNATVICKESRCGTLYGKVRYNSSGTEPNTDVSTTPGDVPFYTFDLNPQSCNLDQDENYTFIWKVNSTGSLDEYYNIDVIFYNPSNDTTNSLIRIGLVLVLNVSTDEIDWGDRDPDIQGIAAPGNPYQIGLDKNSNDAQGLYIKGTDMAGTSTPIEVSNISWCRACAGYGVSARMNHTYEAIIEPADSGITHSVYFWLDTPPVYTGSYAGTVTIMANASW